MIVFSSDWHADVYTQGVDRFPEVEAGVLASVDYAVRSKADAYIFCGDLADPHNPRSHRASALAHKAADILRGDEIPSYWLVGNHDVVEDGTGANVLMSLSEANHRTIGSPQWFRLKDSHLPIVALPFTPTSHSYDPVVFIERAVLTMEEEGVDQNGRILVIGHLNLKGITAGSETTDMPRGRDVYWPLDEIKAAWPNATIVAGHYHERQVFQGVQVIGSLARLTYGEGVNEVGYMELEI